jgi:hypothetical protein
LGRIRSETGDRKEDEAGREFGKRGEFGHVPLDPAGPRCACGQKGCWEAFSSNRAACRYYKELQPASRAILFRELLYLAGEGDKYAQEALEKQALYIGRGLRMMVASLSPSVILITGDITSAWPRVRPIIEREAAALTLAGSAPMILPAHDGEIARLRGAAAIALQRRPVRRPFDMANSKPRPVMVGHVALSSRELGGMSLNNCFARSLSTHRFRQFKSGHKQSHIVTG